MKVLAQKMRRKVHPVDERVYVESESKKSNNGDITFTQIYVPSCIVGNYVDLAVTFEEL